MKVIIEIQCDNAAFGDHPGWQAGALLRDLGWNLIDSDGRIEAETLRDSNGNTVGTVRVED